jgi:nitrogen fixation protein FixH
MLGWNGDIGFTQPSLFFQLNDKQGQPIVGAKVVAHIARATKSGLDFKVLLYHNAEGKYESNAMNFPLKGQWDIIVVAEWNQQKYQQSKRIIVN